MDCLEDYLNYRAMNITCISCGVLRLAIEKAVQSSSTRPLLLNYYSNGPVLLLLRFDASRLLKEFLTQRDTGRKHIREKICTYNTG